MSSTEPLPPTLATPDPALSTEAIIAYLVALLGAVVTLFKLDLTQAQQGAAATIITVTVIAFTLWHAGKVRSARALSGGLVNGFLTSVPTPDHDDADAANQTTP